MNSFLNIIFGFADFLPKIAAFIVAVGVLYYVSSFFTFIIDFLLPKNLDKAVRYLIAKVFRIFVFIAGLVLLLNSFGINQVSITAIVGITTLAIGSSLKDTVTNGINVFSILINKPFDIGDTISINGVTGRIVKIEILYTKLDSGDEIKLIPNSMLTNQIVTIKK